MDAPQPVALDGFAGRIERQAVDPANRVDFGPVLADVHILKGDMIGPVGAEAWPAAARVKALTLRHEFWNAADGLSDPASFVRSEFAGAETVTLGIIAAEQPRHRHAVGVPDHVALRILPDQAPGRLERTGWLA